MKLSKPTTPTVTPRNRRADVTRSRDPLWNPFTILVDTAEQEPYQFQGLHADSDRKGRLLTIAEGLNWRRACLGRHPESLGDYSVDGFVGRVAVERKSQDDCYGTLLGWHAEAEASRRARFEKELTNLANLECACVVVECSLSRLLAESPQYDQGKKTARCNQKILSRSILAYAQDYRVPWLFYDSRAEAEAATFRFLERFYEKHRKELKA